MSGFFNPEFSLSGCRYVASWHVPAMMLHDELHNNDNNVKQEEETFVCEMFYLVDVIDFCIIGTFYTVLDNRYALVTTDDVQQ